MWEIVVSFVENCMVVLSNGASLDIGKSLNQWIWGVGRVLLLLLLVGVVVLVVATAVVGTAAVVEGVVVVALSTGLFWGCGRRRGTPYFAATMRILMPSRFFSRGRCGQRSRKWRRSWLVRWLILKAGMGGGQKLRGYGLLIGVVVVVVGDVSVAAISGKGLGRGVGFAVPFISISTLS